MKIVRKSILRYNKCAALILLHILISVSVSGQTDIAFTDLLRQKFTFWRDSMRWEEVYVGTDRQEYIAGENLWFSVFLVDRLENKPLLNDRIVYFELLSPGNMPVYQKRVLGRDGFGQGQMIIPDTLSSGTYTLRAYTNRMKNFLPSGCFMKDIRIYNAFNDKPYKEKKPVLDLFSKGLIELKSSEPVKTSLSFTADNSRPDTVTLVVTSGKTGMTNNNGFFYLFIQSRGAISHISRETIKGAATSVKIPRERLAPGVNHFTLFDSEHNAAAEKLLFNKSKGEREVLIEVADTFGRREKVTIEASFGGPEKYTTGKPRLSISVAPAGNDKSVSFEDYLVFGSEFGPLPVNWLGGRRLSEVRSEEIDSVLSEVKSSRINWKNILAGVLPVVEYPDETEANYLSGKLMTADHSVPGSQEYLFMCIPGKNADIQYTRTDKQGNFTFSLGIDEKQRDLVIFSEKPEKGYKINLGSSYSDKYFPSVQSPASNNDSVTSYISELGFNYQVMKNYGLSSRGKRLELSYDTLTPIRFYGKPDISLNLDDYIRLPKMEEIFFELLPHINLKKKNALYEITITDRVDNSPYVAYPCIMIDGVIIEDASLIAEMNPEIVERIDVVKEKYLLGDYIFPGIVNVITTIGDFSSVSLPDYMVRLQHRVLDPVVSFSSPSYTAVGEESSHIPDFRNTLYWNPSAEAENGNRIKAGFWSADVVNDYVIIVNGFDASGQCVSARKIIHVR